MTIMRRVTSLQAQEPEILSRGEQEDLARAHDKISAVRQQDRAAAQRRRTAAAG